MLRTSDTIVKDLLSKAKYNIFVYDYSRALSFYKQAVELDPQATLDNFSTAELLRNQYKYEAALTNYKIARDLGDFNTRERVLSGIDECLAKLTEDSIKKGKYDYAIYYLTQISNDSTHKRGLEYDLHWCSGNDHYRSGNYQAALADYRLASKVCQNRNILNRITNAERKLGNYEEAIKTVDSIQDLLGDRASLYLAEILVLRGKVNHAAGKIDDAIAQFNLVVDRSGFGSFRSIAQFHLAKILYQQKDFDKAINQCELSLANDTDNWKAMILKAMIHIKMHDFAMVEKSLSDLSNIKYRLQCDIDLVRALFAHEKGDFLVAFPLLTESMKKLPRKESLHVAIEDILCSEKNTKISKIHLFNAIKLFPQEKQVMLLKMCLDKNTQLGGRMWKQEGFRACSATSGTLEKIMQQLKSFEPNYIYDANEAAVPSLDANAALLFSSRPAVNDVAAPFHNENNNVTVHINNNSL